MAAPCVPEGSSFPRLLWASHFAVFCLSRQSRELKADKIVVPLIRTELIPYRLSSMPGTVFRGRCECAPLRQKFIIKILMRTTRLLQLGARGRVDGARERLITELRSCCHLRPVHPFRLRCWGNRRASSTLQISKRYRTSMILYAMVERVLALYYDLTATTARSSPCSQCSRIVRPFRYSYIHTWPFI